MFDDRGRLYEVKESLASNKATRYDVHEPYFLSDFLNFAEW